MIFRGGIIPTVDPRSALHVERLKKVLNMMSVEGVCQPMFIACHDHQLNSSPS